MKKRTRKLASILTAAAMLTSLSAAVWADPAQIGSNGTVTSAETSVYIAKSINVTNPLDTTVYSPSTTYTYSIVPATVAANSTVTDADGHTGKVVAGVNGGAVLDATTLTLNSTAVTANQDTDEVTGNIKVNIDLSVFTEPGIYRYKITDETTDAILHNSGLERSAEYDTVRYLDVYIKRDATSGDLVVLGYALFNGKVLDVDGNGETEVSVATNTAKSTGYVSGSEPGTGTDNLSLTDIYRTYNVTITKQVTGEMGNKTHPFPFTIAVNSNGTNSHYFAGLSGSTAANPVATNSISTQLTHGQTFQIIGLSPLDTVNATETNDTYDTYTVSVDNADGNIVPGTPRSNGQTLAVADTPFQVSTYDTTAGTHGTSASVPNDTLTFTNNLAAISPTGVIIRSLPYVAMVVIAGAMLVAIKMLNKSEKKEENKNEAN